jgi:hypothetical protein
MDSNLSDTYRTNLINSMVRKPGLRGRLNVKCIECIYDPYQQGSWRKQVGKCTVYDCALYHKRPMPGSKGGHKSGDI